MKKSIYNVVFGILGQIITILIGLLLPKFRIDSFGSEVNGMVSSVTQIIAYLSLLEAGVGSATLQALYKPVAQNSKEEINGIMAATDKYYKKTGCIYLVAIVLLSVVYPLFVKTDISTITIVLVILFNGCGNVLAYFFQGKYKILLQAEGKQYVIINLTTIVTVISGVSKILLIVLGFDIISLQIVFFVVNIIQVLYFALYIKRHYKWLNINVEPNKHAIEQKNSVLIHQISQLIFNNTDVLLLTIFCDLRIVSVYVLYNMIFDMISTLIGNFNNGFIFKLGQLYNTDRLEFNKFYKVYEKYYMAISFALYCVTFLLILPFMKLYVGNVNDINYIDPLLPILFLIIKVLVSGRALCGVISSVAGHFRKTQNRSIIELLINLISSVVLVNFFGIYGVLIGTILALLYRANDMIIYANVKLVHRNPWQTYKLWIINICVFLIFFIINKMINPHIESYFDFLTWGIVYTCFTMIIFVGIVYIQHFTESNRILKSLFKKIIKNK